jgi:hypothetical protein
MRQNDEVIEIPNGLSEEVAITISKAGIAGLDVEKAEELGAIDRISYMLCLMHACISAAYRVFGQVDWMLNMLHGRKHLISRTCNQFEKDFTSFLNFWRQQGFQSKEGTLEMNTETELLYHQVMRWAQLPEQWSLGDPQHVEDDSDVFISVDMNDRILKFHRSTVESEMLSEISEKWCVTKLDVKTKEQTTIYEDMDKASAQMSAKRLSSDDKENIYTATILRTFDERRTDALPMRAYRDGNEVGRIGKEFKQKK